MARLIALTSLGSSDYRRTAELCLRSLRTHGRFRGDIVVFSNNDFATDDPNVRVLPAPEKLDRRAMHEYKPAAAAQLETSGYDRVLVMDSDMIAIADIAPLFDLADAAVCGVEERPWTRMVDAPCGGCLSESEKRMVGDRWGVNGGLLCAPSTLFRRAMSLWFSEIRAQHGQLNEWLDQPPLNRLIATGQIPFRAYPHGWVDMPPMYRWNGGEFRVTHETKLLHLCWPDKEQASDEMETLLDALDDRRLEATRVSAGQTCADPGVRPGGELSTSTHSR